MVHHPYRQTQSFHDIVIKYKLQVLDVASANARFLKISVKRFF